MIIDKPITRHEDLMREAIEWETEGSRVPPTPEPTEEVERLMAGDLIAKMRRVKEHAPRWSEITREAYAKRFEALSLEAAAAAAWLKRHRSDDEFVPAFLRAE